MDICTDILENRVGRVSNDYLKVTPVSIRADRDPAAIITCKEQGVNLNLHQDAFQDRQNKTANMVK